MGILRTPLQLDQSMRNAFVEKVGAEVRVAHRAQASAHPKRDDFCWRYFLQLCRADAVQSGV